mgnify:CR=1 FL=1
MNGLPDWARAWGGVLGSARVAARCEDFRVDEVAGFAASGEGAHLLVRIEKAGLSTSQAIDALARYWQVERRAMGYAGRKDRAALARQWLSVPWPPTAGLPAPGAVPLAREGPARLRVIDIERHRRKLPVGALAGNDFQLTLRDVDVAPAAMQARLVTIARHGVPNYFGGQRFGRDAANLERVHGWFAGGSRPRSRNDRSMLLSAARAAVFNTLLDARVRDGDWNRVGPGELLVLDGRGSLFAAQADDAAFDQRRGAALRVHPTGPLVGRPRRGLVLPAALAEREAQCLASCRDLIDGLSGAGVEAARRPLRLGVQRLGGWQMADGNWRLTFRLMRGGFATAVLREIVAWPAP